MKVRRLVYQGWFVAAGCFFLAAVCFFRLDDSPLSVVLRCCMLTAGGFVSGCNLMFYRWVTVFGYWAADR